MAGWATDEVEALLLNSLRQLERGAIEDEVRAQAKTIYLGDHTATCRILGQHLIFVDTRDYAHATHLMWDGFWEMWITMAMARCIEPGMVVADVGANFGYYSLLLAEAVGPRGSVYAMEPNVHIAGLLRKSASVNGFRERITVDTRAASSTTGDRLRFFIPDGHPMNAAILPAGADEAALPEPGVLTDVETVKLDDALPERVDFLKIDAEGAERDIWQGLTKTLRANDGIRIFLEFNCARYESESAAFLDEIEEMDFQLAFVDYDGGVKRTTRSDILSRGATDVILSLSK
jgi:FkbM family methyltransferase